MACNVRSIHFSWLYCYIPYASRIYILAEDLQQLDFLATCWPQLKPACISHPIWGVKSIHWS